jgi:hypothetical protein
VWLQRILFGFSAVAIAGAVALALKPIDLSGGFITSGGSHGHVLVAGSSSCGPPIVNAFRSADSGWFAYTLRGTASDGPGKVVTCSSEARSRLKLSVVSLLGGIVLGVVASRLRRRSEGDDVAFAPS